MSGEKSNLSRRDFFKMAGAVGVGSLLSRNTVLAETATKPAETAPAATQPAGTVVPLRPLGKTGVRVPILALGGIFDIPSNQLILKQALKWGVCYWDTAHGYQGGRSEEGMGMHFAKQPDDRKKVFLVSKTPARGTDRMTEDLQTSLERLKTDNVDMFFLHQIRSARELRTGADDWKRWAEEAKKSGKIRFFGFSTHRNMPECLQAAADMGFIDGIMLTYSHRQMHTDEMKAAVDAASKAGIGLVAMKTQGGGQRRGASETESELLDRFLSRKFSIQQARLKAVWEEPRIASICSAMYTTSVLSSNVAAAMDKTKLSAAEKDLLRQYAAQTCSGYCAGCASICEAAVDNAVPVADVMRCLMYYNDYGDRELARASFAQLPAAARRRLVSVDYAAAELRCPNRMPIRELMVQAAEQLT